MKVLVIGAAGKTGKLIVERAVAAGHQITAFVHDPASFHSESADVRVVAGDAGDSARLKEAMAGQEAVIDAVGGKTPFIDSGLEQSVAKSVLAAMQENGVRRLLVISATGVGESKEQATFFYEHLLMPTFLRGAMKDKAAMEAEVKQSGVDFVLARPPALSDDPPTGKVRVIEGDAKAHRITRGDLAQFLVDQLQSDQYLGQAVTVANE